MMQLWCQGSRSRTTAISRTISSRCCSKTVGVAARPPEPGVDWSQAIGNEVIGGFSRINEIERFRVRPVEVVLVQRGGGYVSLELEV